MRYEKEWKSGLVRVAVHQGQVAPIHQREGVNCKVVQTGNEGL